ncbi:hypothetical protein DVB69_15520 [Sporosarcina sp. BI001-red]|nr:hypothetical protein DVB69_15520 [Sporosarcina sp. BI001-red]
MIVDLIAGVNYNSGTIHSYDKGMLYTGNRFQLIITRVNSNNFFSTNSITNLYSKTGQEDKLRRMSYNVLNDVEVIWDSDNTNASKIISFKFDKYVLEMIHLESNWN